MNIDSINLFRINDTKEQELFKKALVFFDASSVLDFYYFSDDSRSSIFENVFEPLADRLWMTHQTEYEFLKNREKVFVKPIDAYEKLKGISKQAKDGGHLEEIESSIKSLANIVRTTLAGHLKTLREKTSKSEKHPFLEGVDFDGFEHKTRQLESTVANYHSTFNDFKQKIEEKIESQKQALSQTLVDDPLLPNFKKYFKTTEPTSYQETLKIVEEGELRFRNSIPPGYLDQDTKIGFQKYGDLISWKQIITKCKNDNNDVILVINDMKEDWWYYPEKDTPDGPRHELIVEFLNETGCLLWMYNMNAFLFKSKQYLAATIEEKVIEDVKNATQPKSDLELVNEIKDTLIRDLFNSASFSKARASLQQLSTFPDFSVRQINDIVVACLNNNQIYWIRTDPDIQELITGIIKPHRDKIDFDHLPDFENMYDYTKELT